MAPKKIGIEGGLGRLYLSRRDFLKTAGIVSATAFLAACGIGPRSPATLPSPTPTPTPLSSDELKFSEPHPESQEQFSPYNLKHFINIDGRPITPPEIEQYASTLIDVFKGLENNNQVSRKGDFIVDVYTNHIDPTQTPVVVARTPNFKVKFGQIDESLIDNTLSVYFPGKEVFFTDHEKASDSFGTEIVVDPTNQKIYKIQKLKGRSLINPSLQDIPNKQYNGAFTINEVEYNSDNNQWGDGTKPVFLPGSIHYNQLTANIFKTFSDLKLIDPNVDNSSTLTELTQLLFQKNYTPNGESFDQTLQSAYYELETLCRVKITNNPDDNMASYYVDKFKKLNFTPEQVAETVYTIAKIMDRLKALEETSHQIDIENNIINQSTIFDLIIQTTSGKTSSSSISNFNILPKDVQLAAIKSLVLYPYILSATNLTAPENEIQDAMIPDIKLLKNNKTPYLSLNTALDIINGSFMDIPSAKPKIFIIRTHDDSGYTHKAYSVEANTKAKYLGYVVPPTEEPVPLITTSNDGVYTYENLSSSHIVVDPNDFSLFMQQHSDIKLSDKIDRITMLDPKYLYYYGYTQEKGHLTTGFIEVPRTSNKYDPDPNNPYVSLIDVNSGLIDSVMAFFSSGKQYQDDRWISDLDQIITSERQLGVRSTSQMGFLTFSETLKKMANPAGYFSHNDPGMRQLEGIFQLYGNQFSDRKTAACVIGDKPVPILALIRGGLFKPNQINNAYPQGYFLPGELIGTASQVIQTDSTPVIQIGTIGNSPLVIPVDNNIMVVNAETIREAIGDFINAIPFLTIYGLALTSPIVTSSATWLFTTILSLPTLIFGL